MTLPASHPTTLAELLALRADQRPDDRALVFLADNGAEQAMLTYGALRDQAHALAARLSRDARPGERAVLMLPTGPQFAIALFACALAGLVSVPIMPPRRLATRDASDGILNDCAPRLLLTISALLEGTRGDRLRRDGMTWIALDREDLQVGDHPGPLPPPPSPETLALLQYTSGSTSEPKGVMVSHANLLSNLAAIAKAFGNHAGSTYVSWGPLYHDMGLVMDLLQPIYLGALGVLMRPAAFVQRPLTWLRAIHHYRAEVAGAPNFAFDLCAVRLRAAQMEGIDLSHWKVAFNGAEPVRAATLERFAQAFAPYGFDARALYPCYGLAEATLMVAGGRRGEGAAVHSLSRAGLAQDCITPPASVEDARAMVSSGRAVADTTIAIVDPASGTRCPADKVGEIWIAGPGVAQGYWGKPDASAATFAACIPGDDAVFLRTGDLGFVAQDGALTITGRVKDVLIVRGMNHYPQDIEDTVSRSHPALSAEGAVFMAGDEAERIIVAHEVNRHFRRDLAVDEIVDAVRETVAREHELSVQEVILLDPGALPKTTSGKVRRSAVARLWREGGLKRPAPPS